MRNKYWKPSLRQFCIAGSSIGLALSVTVGAAAQQIELPEGPGRDLVYGTCRTCHDLGYLVESAGVPASTWGELIDSMKQYGMRIPPERRAKILEYLSTYLADTPPPSADAATAHPTEGPSGSDLFAEQCSACHQMNGKGLPGQFPPLDANPDLMRDRLFPAYVVLNGIQGKISVNGKKYNGQMPSFAHLSDSEIAAIIEYVRGAWSNTGRYPANLKSLDANAVKEARAKAMTPKDVHAYRDKLQ